MNAIAFSHEYPKLHNQTSGTLLRADTITIVNGDDSSDRELLEYDTTYYEDGVKRNYQLDDGVYLLLVFLGNLNIPFTTIRRWTMEKAGYYKGLVGETLVIERRFGKTEQSHNG